MTSLNRSDTIPPATSRDMAAVDSATMTPNGAAWSAILAAGIGCASLGSLVILAESSKRMADLLKFSKPVGPLSGKTTLTVIIWLIAWAILHLLWRNRQVRADRSWTMTLILVF